MNPINSFITYVNEPINFITFFGDTLYVSVRTTDSIALVYRWTGFVLEEAFSLSEVDSEITTMHQYENKLFLGCKNGNLYSYDESTLSVVRSFSFQFMRIYSDNSLLYIVPRNAKKLFVYDGKIFSEVQV